MTFEKDVHTEHCCLKHGCKYGDEDCPVAIKAKPQSYPCEWCQEDAESDMVRLITYLEARMNSAKSPLYTNDDSAYYRREAEMELLDEILDEAKRIREA